LEANAYITGLEVLDDLAEPNRRFVPVINRAGRFDMAVRTSSTDVRCVF
jgi:hypothetical protein